jgi:hypothetical protein
MTASEIYLSDWSVSLQEVRFQEDVKQVASDALNSVINRKDVNAFSILDVSALYMQGISEEKIIHGGCFVM